MAETAWIYLSYKNILYFLRTLQGTRPFVAMLVSTTLLAMPFLLILGMIIPFRSANTPVDYARYAWLILGHFAIIILFYRFIAWIYTLLTKEVTISIPTNIVVIYAKAILIVTLSIIIAGIPMSRQSGSDLHYQVLTWIVFFIGHLALGVITVSVFCVYSCYPVVTIDAAD
jgi:hypothetical protein